LNKIIALTFGLLLAATISVTSAAQEVGYVSDVFHVPVRSGAGTQFRIVHAGLRSGTRVEVHEVEGDWARITTDSGIEGWMPAQYLADDPPARNQLAQAEQRLAAVQKQNAELKAQVQQLQQENSLLQQQVEEYKQEAAQATEELAELRTLSADAINLNRRHRELLEQHQLLQTTVDALRAENDRLASDTTVNKWLYGAGLLVFGMLLSIIIPVLKPKKRFSDWA
jgi:SH3 domain protein